MCHPGEGQSHASLVDRMHQPRLTVHCYRVSNKLQDRQYKDIFRCSEKRELDRNACRLIVRHYGQDKSIVIGCTYITMLKQTLYYRKPWTSDLRLCMFLTEI